MRPLLVCSVLLACASPAAAQAPATPAPSLPSAGSSAPSPAASAPAESTDSSVPAQRGRLDPARAHALRARYHVRQMESVLERAVQHAADVMSRRLHAMSSDVMALAGSPRAQGFRIDGYGLFFSVEVPRLSESVNWALRVLSQDRNERVLSSLQQVAKAQTDAAVRADIERAIRSMELQLAASGHMAGPRPAAARGQGPAPVPLSPVPSERVQSQEISESSPVAPTSEALSAAAVTSPPAPTEAPPAPQDRLLDAPSAAYEDEVKDALIDAVLDYAGSLPMDGAEWVTVAARDAGYVAFPDAVADMVTVTLSIRAADLAEFRAQRLTRDQARTRVLVREF